MKNLKGRWIEFHKRQHAKNPGYLAWWIWTAGFYGIPLMVIWNRREDILEWVSSLF